MELRTEASVLRADLAAAQVEAEWLALTACKHPAGAVDTDYCHACNTDLW